MIKRIFFPFFSLFLFFSGFSLWKFTNLQKMDHHSYSHYIELLDLVKNIYPEKKPIEDLIYSSIDGMIEFLDPHSNFLDPETYKAMVQRQQGRFYGIGILVGLRNGKITVISPVEGTPAYRLGVKAGDIIVEIDGKSTENMSLNEVVNRLRGEKDTVVEVTFLRAGVKDPIKISIKREMISETAVRYVSLLEDKIGYIRITDFNKTTSQELREGLEKLKKEKIEKLIIDLRDNPGGILDQAIEVSQFFLKPGSLVVFTRGRHASSVMELKTKPKTKPYEYPLIILVNSGSASASEIVAGALQDHDRALIVGETTFGKGLVQSVFELPQETALALTTARYYIPSGRCIQRDYSFLTDYLKGANGKNSEREYYTSKGRKVYGGGGVTPDFIVSSGDFSQTQLKLQSLGLYFDFAVNFLSENPSIDESFVLNEEVLKKFFDYLKEKKWIKDKEIENILKEEREINTIKFFLKREILSVKFGMTKGYQLTLKEDEQIKAAIMQFPEAEKLSQEYFGN